MIHHKIPSDFTIVKNRDFLAAFEKKCKFVLLLIIHSIQNARRNSKILQ